VEVAAAVLGIADEKMTNAIEEITVRQGLDPAASLVVAGGGASGLSIDRIARELGCAGVLFPRPAATLTACGGVVCELAADFRRSFYTRSGAFDGDGVTRVLEALHREASGYVGRLGQEHEGQVDCFVAARYVHQQWEIEVPVPQPTGAGERLVDRLVETFHDEHRRLFSVSEPGQTVEFISWRARAVARAADPARPARLMHGPHSRRAGVRARPVHFRGYGWLDAQIRSGAALAPGDTLDGPAIVEEPATTVVVQPGSTLAVLESGDYLLRSAERRAVV
jgi:N-methylhydantoinase A